MALASVSLSWDLHPYPFPATVAYLTSSIKKLREAEPMDQRSRPFDLFRGMANIDNRIEESEFMEPVEHDDTQPGPLPRRGGTELALSTSMDLKTAIMYSASRTPLIFKIKTNGFRQRGGNIAALSCFPEEVEVLYPPLTCVHIAHRLSSHEHSPRLLFFHARSTHADSLFELRDVFTQVYLQPTGRIERVGPVEGVTFTIVEVEPDVD